MQRPSFRSGSQRHVLRPPSPCRTAVAIPQSAFGCPLGHLKSSPYIRTVVHSYAFRL